MKKRLLSILLALMMIIGMIPLTTLTAFAAQYTAVGVSVQSDGVVCDNGWYYLDDPSLYLLYSDNGSTFASSVSPLYTDEECFDYLTSAPVLGEKYYFQVFAYAYSDTDYSVTTSKSSIDVEGFCSGRVEDAYKDGAVYIVTCSIIYGELTGGVKAVASGVEYDSAEGGYAPNFTTLKAVSTEGKELEYTMVDGKYSYYGAKSGCLYKTNSGTNFSNMLTTEPQAGETYYSYIKLDSIDGNLNIEEELVDIQIPGYEVEYIASYERDMGFTSMVVYSVKSAKDGWVEENGKWYYYQNGAPTTGWLKDGTKWYYMDANGAMLTGWQKVDGKWYYLNNNMKTGWQQIGGKWYYLGTNGAMTTGWQKVSGKWYYMNANGVMQTGWQKISGKWYYLNSEMKTGWQKISGKWYYLNTEMKTGWQQIGGKWYYLGTDGAMRTGWVQLSGKWYYLNSSGVMVTGTQVIDGKTYKFNSSGVWIA